MADERQSLSPFVILRVFAAAFVLLFGLGMMFKSAFSGVGMNDWTMLVGAVFAACGLTFFALLWFYGRR
jgi:protein-S-isoprenylcysteine O-methyltransferase Ste14